MDSPVAINYLKRFVADYVLNHGLNHDLKHDLNHDLVAQEVIEDIPQKNKKVAVIGAGPAGLTCVRDLAENGYQVTIFEREDKPGGTLYTGIPGFRLDKEVLFKDIDIILKNKNINIEYGINIGKDKSIEDIKKDGYEAVFIATGSTKSRALKIKGIKAEGVLNGIDFLYDVNTGKNIRLDGAVIVIGGGNVAVDSARTALRLGAKKVIIVYRRTRKEMPAYSWEIEEALEEGLELYNPRPFLYSPAAIKAIYP
ncbi:NADPH-Fe(3+) oxidoreductase subunit beta [subsurface metagenome]